MPGVFAFSWRVLKRKLAALETDLVLPNQLCDHFLTWQCRIRQVAMREEAGRPSQGMRPRVLDAEGNELSAGIIVLIIRENPRESTEFLKFQVQKHNDPQDVYKKSLTFLQSTHYHRAIEFSDEMTALFAKESPLVERLMIEGKCILEFNQFGQRYAIPCRLRIIAPQEQAYEATLWHNRVFNPNIGDDIQIVGFLPDWDEAVAMLEKDAARQA